MIIHTDQRNHMTPDIYFEQTQNFLETKPASKKLMSYLSGSSEIGVVIGNNIECSYFKQHGEPKFERKPAKSPDVILHLSPEAIDSILKNEGLDLGELVVDVVKLYLAGLVKITFPAPIPLLLIRGYAQVLKASHAQLLGLLKDRGLDSLSVPSIIQKLKSLK